MFRLICLVALLATVFAKSSMPPGATLKKYFCNDDRDCANHCPGSGGFCGDDNICQQCEAPTTTAQSTMPPTGTTMKKYFCNDDQDCDNHCSGNGGFCGDNNICHRCEPPTTIAFAQSTMLQTGTTPKHFSTGDPPASTAAVLAQSTMPSAGTTQKHFVCNDDQDCDRHCSGYRGFCENSMCQHCEAPVTTACNSEFECLQSCRHNHQFAGVCYHKQCRCSFFG